MLFTMVPVITVVTIVYYKRDVLQSGLRRNRVKTSTDSEAFEFCWKVARAGYEWKNDSRSKPSLFACNVPGKGILIYKPMKKNPGLFRDFSELEGKKEILEFANQYGLLFDRYSGQDGREEKGSYQSVEAAFGIGLANWQHQIGDMRALVAIWDSVRASKIADLKHIITWRNGGVEYQISTPKRKCSAWLTLPGVAHRFTEGDVLVPAQDALQKEINARLSGEVDRISGEGRLRRIECVPQLAWTPDGDQQLALTPLNLLGAMWLQFALVVAGAYQLRRCAACGKYFHVGKGVQRRADAKTCSDACRQRKKREGL
jgi:hypothetical protein